MEPLLITAFVLGVTSNFHCIGMCGPIAMAVPLNRTSHVTKIWGILQYNLGRILAYSVLGLIIGSIGITIDTIGFLQILSIISGILMIVYAWNRQLSAMLKFPPIASGMQGIVTKAFGQAIRGNHPMKLYFLGMLNGLLPCGMVVIALANALLLGTPLKGALAMSLFGIATLPAMMTVGYAANSISGNLRAKFTKAVPYLLTIVGILVVLRGMNLNIPMISPRIELIKQEKQQALEKRQLRQEVEMSCCHAPKNRKEKNDSIKN